MNYRHLNTAARYSNEDEAHDPMDAIYALNIGDFAADSFFSDELLGKIHRRVGDDPDKLKAQLEELIRIYSIDRTLAVLGLDPQKGFLIYDSIAATLARLFQADACHLFQIATRETGEQYLGLSGTSAALEQDRRWEISLPTGGDDFLSMVCRDETVVHGCVSELPGWQPIERLGQSRTTSVLAAPLREGARATGLLLLESHRESGGEAGQETAFPPEALSLARITTRLFVTGMRLQVLLSQARDGLDGHYRPDNDHLLGLRAQITESIADLSSSQQEFLEALSAAVDARCHFTRGHSGKTAELARRIAEALELNEKTVDLIYLSALLGSLGRVDVPREILHKKENLTASEWDCLRMHPNVGVSLLVKIHFLSEVVPYVASRHERWDGSGVPEGLKGRSIPLGSRIIAVAGVYSAMTQERPYREQALSPREAMEALRQEADVHWDPLVVNTLGQILQEEFL